MTIEIKDPSQLPFTLRTPSHVAVPMGCQAMNSCDGKVLATLGGGVSAGPWSVTVGPPWYIADGYTCAWFLPEATLPPMGCVKHPGYAGFTIWTDDPNAPSRNIVISAASPGQSCP
jgi:hypothetical protein